MLVQPFERPGEAALPSLLQDANPLEGGFGSSTNATGSPMLDIVSRFTPPWMNGNNDPGNGNAAANSSPFCQIGQLLAQLVQMLQQFMQGGCGGPGSGQQYFQNATGSSTGDPHLSFDNNHWDNMTSQPNLLDSNSFGGGYRVSTQVTPPDQNGVTYNREATIAADYGMTQVSLDKSGSLTVLRDGENVALAPGQTLQLGDGETVARTQNGVTMTATNERGGSVTTTLTANGTGVDVQTSANNVDLGGALVSGNVAQPYKPVYNRYGT
ncbi:MAG: hypothetical protein M3R51_02260 [Candidatus Eremiobacteraeota bacterium]|nr:hypothetical protein [Candidatus Eremiobacteraeota bacterium]